MSQQPQYSNDETSANPIWHFSFYHPALYAHSRNSPQLASESYDFETHHSPTHEIVDSMIRSVLEDDEPVNHTMKNTSENTMSNNVQQSLNIATKVNHIVFTKKTKIYFNTSMFVVTNKKIK